MHSGMWPPVPAHACTLLASRESEHSCSFSHDRRSRRHCHVQAAAGWHDCAHNATPCRAKLVTACVAHAQEVTTHPASISLLFAAKCGCRGWGGSARNPQVASLPVAIVHGRECEEAAVGLIFKGPGLHTGFFSQEGTQWPPLWGSPPGGLPALPGSLVLPGVHPRGRA